MLVWAMTSLFVAYAAIVVTGVGNELDQATVSHVCYKDTKPFLFGEVDWGLTNQRWETLVHLAIAKRFNLTYVPATLQLDLLKECPGHWGWQPFHVLYSSDVLMHFGASHGISITTEVADEIKRLCCTSSPAKYIEQMEAMEPVTDPVCANHHTSFYHLPLMLGMAGRSIPDINNFYLLNEDVAMMRPALYPSEMIARQVTYVLQSLIREYGECSSADVAGQNETVLKEARATGECRLPSFGVIHVREKEDFAYLCSQFAIATQKKCHYRADQVESLLPSLGLQPGTLIQVASGLPLASMGKLCTTYKCFKATDLWEKGAGAGDFPCVPRDVKASIEFWVATKGTSFFGNFYSSFSAELVAIYKAAGLTAEFYNEPCQGENDGFCA